MFHPLINAAISADEVEVLKYNGSVDVVVPFAENDDGTLLVALECRGRLVWYEGRSFYDFCFCVTVTPDPTDREECLEIWTPEASAQYIPTEIRQFLLPTVAECYKAMVREIGSMAIYRVCYAANGDVPHRNEVLTNTLENEGYEVEETGNDELGRVFWMMVPQSKIGG